MSLSKAGPAGIEELNSIMPYQKTIQHESNGVVAESHAPLSIISDPYREERQRQIVQSGRRDAHDNDCLPIYGAMWGPGTLCGTGLRPLNVRVLTYSS